MKPELAMKLAEGIELLHLNGNLYYSTDTLAKTVGVSTSTVKRNRGLVKSLDVALHLADSIDEVQ